MNSATTLDLGVPNRKLDVHDYHRMGEAGILTPGDRVELIDGEIIQMTPVGDPHVDLAIVLTARLSAAVANQAFVSVRNPLRLDDYTEPEPDLVLLRFDRRRGVPLAGDALLVIEVADSSLAYDRDIKIPRYARSGIAETWLFDIESATLTRFQIPEKDDYKHRDIPDLAQPISPLKMCDAPVDLSKLFAIV